MAHAGLQDTAARNAQTGRQRHTLTAEPEEYMSIAECLKG